MGDLYWEVVRHLTMAQATMVAPANPMPNGTEGAGSCANPRFSYSDWEKTGEDRWFEGQGVMQRIHYERVETDTCTSATTTQRKTEGPFRLWQAVPDERVADVNRPVGDEQAVSGAPLGSSDPSGSGGSAKGPETRPDTGAPGNRSDSQKGPPYLPSLALLVAILVVGLRRPRQGSEPDPGSGTSPDPQNSDEPGWWRRFKGWASAKWEDAQDRWADLKAWGQYVAFPWVRYGAQVAGLYTAGLVFEVVNSLGLSIPAFISSLVGGNPDEIDDGFYQMGRMAGAKAVELWGYIAILFGGTQFLGGTGVAVVTAPLTGGLSSALGVGAAQVGLGVAAAGFAHVRTGQTNYEKAQIAYRRSGGESSPKRPTALLSEAEVRKLLGPKASKKAVKRFMEFQEYARQKLGANYSNAKVRELYDNGLGPALERWVSELPPDKVVPMLEHYTGNRRLLAAIHENRFARQLATNSDVVVLKVNGDVAHRGADIVYLDRKTMTIKFTEVKSSLAGSYFGAPKTFKDHMAKNMDKVRKSLRKHVKNGVLTAKEAEHIERTLNKTYELEIVVEGTATVTDTAREVLSETLGIPLERITIQKMR